MAIISDLSGQQENRVPYNKNRFIDLNRDNFNLVMQSIQPMIRVRLNDNSTSKKDIKPTHDLVFHSIKSFTPDEIALQLPELKDLIDDRKYLSDLLSKLDTNTILKQELFSLPRIDEIKAEDIGNKSGLIKPDTEDKKYTINMLMTFSKYIAQDENEHLHLLIIKSITSIDNKLSEEMDNILHMPEFQALEAKWMALHGLVEHSETDDMLKIALLNVSSSDLFADLDGCTEFDQSHIFELMYEKEYGTIGGSPYSCIVFDEYFGKNDYDVHFLTLLSKVCAAAHTPMLSSVKPEMFDLRSFNDMHLPRDLALIFENDESVKWNAFRKTEDSRYVNLFLPRMLIRKPYDSRSTRGFAYNENVVGEDNSRFCWGNPAFLMATRVNVAVSEYGWAAAIRGAEGGGLVENLPSYSFRTEFADICTKCPTQTQISDRRERELSNLGFIALCHRKMTDQAVFFGSQSVHLAPEYDDPYANGNAKISSRMPYMLNASRFAHYIKVILRDKIGSFQSASQMEYYLQSWISQYVLLSDDADQAIKARYPLREAEIIVSDSVDDPGQYDVLMRLRPHFQLEAVSVSIRLVAEI